MPPQDTANARATDELLAARYQVLRELGQGGMGQVYAVRDISDGRVVALKLLTAAGPRAELHRAHFEREYYTLRELNHPAIIDVYDYGLDNDCPFYTMELLPSGDIGQSLPLDWMEAVDVLGAVASSLAVIHSRGLLHRDISEGNVRRDATGRSKLIDFGAMTEMGPVRQIVGTPPYMPPEALNQQSLDQRSDLYAVGALGYRLLTGQHAYPARDFSSLRRQWLATPLRVHDRNPKVPEALGDLIHSLLKFDPLARPSSAAELIEKLSAISGKPLDEGHEVRQAYLTTPRLVARDAPVAAARAAMSRARRKKGTALLATGGPGIGRSRYLDACVVEGELRGALVLRADATSLEDFDGIRTLVGQLRSGLPDGVLEEPSQLALLDNERVTDAQRPALQEAVKGWLLAAARKQLLVIALDDLHLLDEPSASLIALIAQEAPRNRLVVAATLCNDEAPTADRAVALFTRAATEQELEPLTLEDSEALLRSVFGLVPHVGLLANRLHALSEGNPGALMELAQHLVSQDEIRYAGGRWAIPKEITPSDLPTRVQQAYEVRLARLSPSARTLATALALCPEISFVRDEHIFLGQFQGAAAFHAAIGELVAARILHRRGQRHMFGVRAWIDLLRRAGGAALTGLHRRLADVLERRGTEPLLVASHLWAAGERGRALDQALQVAHILLHRDQPEHRDARWLQLSRSREHAAVLRAALEHCDGVRRPARERHVLQLALALTALFGDFAVIKEMLPLVRPQLEYDCGLADYEASDTSEPPAVRLQRALGAAKRRFEETSDEDPEAKTVFSPRDAIRFLVRLAHHTIGIAASTFDLTLMESQSSLGPLAAISPAAALVVMNSRAASRMIRGESEAARNGYIAMLERMDQTDRAGLDEVLHHYVRLAFVYVVAHLEAGLGRETALIWADQLDSDPLHQVNAQRVQTNYYLTTGDSVRANACRHQVELLQIQNSPTQFFEGSDLFRYFPPYAAADDLLNVKASLHAVSRLAALYPGWIPVREYVDGEYRRIRGEDEQALACFGRALELTDATTHHIWARAAEQYLFMLTSLDRAPEAVSLGHDWNQRWIEHGLLGGVGVALAAAQSATGDHRAAATRIDGITVQWKERGIRGVQLGRAYEVGARVALQSGDVARFQQCKRLCGQEYMRGQTPALVSKYERLNDAGRRAGFESGGREETRQTEQKAMQKVQSRLAESTCTDDLASRCLELLKDLADSETGWLFWIDQDEATLLAGPHALPSGLSEFVNEQIAAEQVEAATMTVTGVAAATVFDHDGGRFRPIMLRNIHADNNRLVAIAILEGVSDQVEAIGVAPMIAIVGALLECPDLPAGNSSGQPAC